MQTDAVVYIVDDDEAVRRSLGLLLKSTGITSKLYASAQEFLDYYDSSKPGCLLLDIRMPGMDGLEFLKKLSQTRPSLPTLVMTGFGDTPDEAKDALRREVSIYLEDCEKLGILDEVLIEAGFYDNDEVWMSSQVVPPHEPRITII